MNISNQLYWGMAAMALSFSAQAYPGESIVRDPVTGDYTITYRGDAKSTELSQTIYVPPTKTAPTVHSNFRLGDRGAISYRYSIANGVTAKQIIIGFWLEQIMNPIVGEVPQLGNFATRAEEEAHWLSEYNAIPSPNKWHGSVTRIAGETRIEDINRITWDPYGEYETDGIKPGSTLSNFGLSSMDLPGVGLSRIRGLGEMIGFPDEGPLTDSAVYAELEQLRDNDYVSRTVASPVIAVPVPFDAALLLDRIRTHVATWPSKQLLDPALATQLNRYLVSAADAYRRNQLKAGKEHIETLREMLKREHKDLDHDDDENENGKRAEKNDDRRATQRILIDRLAARILDFDLKYVLKRTEREDNEHKKH